NQDRLATLKELGLPFAPSAEEQAEAEARAEAAAEGKLAGTTWVLTGTLSDSRDKFAQRITSAGGKVSSSISAKTSYLLAGEKAGSKLAKAEKLGVTVLDEAALEELMQEP
ncbi:MAG: BRCT domain-containing protein, partial [Verrucomicrobiota bacterium]